MGWILRIFLFFLLATILLRSAYRFFQGVIEGAGGGGGRASGRRARPRRERS